MDEQWITLLADLLAVMSDHPATAQAVLVVSAACWALAQVMAWIPPRYLARLPRWLVALVQVVAGNYGRAKNGPGNDHESFRSDRRL
jgi:hypothetical protein